MPETVDSLFAHPDAHAAQARALAKLDGPPA